MNREEAWHRRRVGRVTLSIALLLMLVAGLRLGSLAVFSDTATVDNNLFSVGGVDIGTNPQTQLVTNAAMAPGDEETGELLVSNDGSMDFRYAVTSTVDAGGDETLAQQLELTVKEGVTTCTDADFATDGTVLYSGDLGSLAGLAIIGSTAQGAQAGDRTLAVGASENLCFNVLLPQTTDETFADQSATATLAFVAEQTVNNP